MSPKEILDAAKSLSRGDRGTFHETAAELRIAGRTDSPQLLRQWQRIALHCESEGFGVVSALNDLDEPVDLKTIPIETLLNFHLRIRLEKVSVPSVFRFFTAAGLELALQSDAVISTATHILIAEQFETFESLGCAFLSWNDNSVPREGKTEECLRDPCMLVRDLTRRTVTKRTGLWIVAAGKPIASAVSAVWSKRVVANLPFLLANEVEEDRGAIRVRLIGPRKCIVPVNINSTGEFDSLQQAALWVYGRSIEAEVRHTLLTYELARIWQDGEDWTSGLTNKLASALEAAQLSYRSHLQGTSKDTLKALSDLRKAVGEETAKILQQTRDLTSGLWKDFALAFGALALRAASVVSPSGVVNDVARNLLRATAVFLFLSIVITIATSIMFFRNASKSRRAWHPKLYSFLTKNDFDNLCDNPISDATKIFGSSAVFVAAMYFGVMALLLWASGDLWIIGYLVLSAVAELI
jgi:hypothetical protein